MNYYFTEQEIAIIKKALIEYEENHHQSEDDKWQEIMNDLISYV